ncbi:MAG: hypothetical protein AB8B72_01520 [Crocinitomicaceae bacterium]
MNLNKLGQIIILLLALVSCSESIEGSWVFSSAKKIYFVDTTALEIDKPDITTFIELPADDTLICSEKGKLSTSKESFNGKWYFDKESYLRFDVNWGPIFNELYMGAGEVIRFKVIENKNEKLKLLYETPIGYSEIIFLKQKPQ